MIDKAIEKTTKEAMAVKHPLAIAIEEYLTNKCTSNTVAMKLLDETKTVKGIYEKIRAKAKAEAKDQFAAISDVEVFGMVDEYYGLGDTSQTGHPSRDADKVDVLDLF